MFHPLVKERRALRDIGVDPDADLEALLVESFEHTLGIGKDARVPLEIAPVELFHPETVKVKDVQRDVALGHAVHKVGHRGLVVIGGERGGQPEAKGPGRGQRRAPGERRVAAQHLLGRGAVDQEILQGLAGHAKLHALDLFRAYFQRDPLRVVDKDAIAAVGQVKGDVLVGPLAAGAAVLVPQVDHLAVLDQWSEPLTQPIYSNCISA